jgi:hypothetical protein
VRVSLRLSELLGAGDKPPRGLVSEIEEECQVDRHTVASWLNNTATYVSLDALGRVADYLVSRGVDKELLPGALIGRVPEYFLDALASCRKFDFCLGTRRSAEWGSSDYVMSCDAQLQGRMLTEISNRVYRANGAAAAEPETHEKPGSPGRGDAAAGTQDAGGGPEHAAIADSMSSDQRPVHSLFPEFNLLRGPDRNLTARTSSDDWLKSQKEATTLYESFLEQPSSALIALGSIKVNPLVEVMLARAFDTNPFRTQDTVSKPRDRRCPILFRFRDKDEESLQRDPQPASCCGGLRLAARTPAPRPGIYYESGSGHWQACRWALPSDDVAFVFYAYRPSSVQVEVACGGYSARSTRCLTRKLEEITAHLGKPQFMSESLHVGLYLIAFTFDSKDKDFDPERDDREFGFRVIPLDDKVVCNRVTQKRAPRRRSAAKSAPRKR